MDIEVTRDKYHAMFKSITIEGKNWLLHNIGEDPVIIQVEHRADLIEDIERAGLNVNEH